MSLSCTFEVTLSDSVTIPGSGLNVGVFSPLPYDGGLNNLALSQDQSFQNQGVAPSDVDAIFTKSITLEDGEPRLKNFANVVESVILFVEAPGLGIVGTCALQKSQGDGFELTKMGVRESARGRKAGEFLLSAAIERGTLLRADPLYLLTNSRCAAAIHLYEKAGFRHDAEIMARYGARYERCDVAMRYRPRTGHDAARLSNSSASGARRSP